MKNMLFESELKVLEVLWKKGDTTAKDLAIELKASTDWSKTTTYTVVQKCVDKGLIERLGTDFTCRVTITKDEARRRETEILVDKMFGGSSDLLISSLLGASAMTFSQMDKLRNMVQEFAAEQ